MKTDSSSRILRWLDAPWKIGLWEVDVAVPFITCLFFGMMHGSPMALGIGVIAGIFIGRWVSRLKAERPLGFAIHLLWWYLPDIFIQMKATPPSHIKEMVG